MIGVMDNGITETRFKRHDDRSRDDYALLEKDRETLVLPGDVSLLIPEVDEIHQMDNHSDRPTVEITRLRQRSEGSAAQQVQPRDLRGQTLRDHTLRQLLARGNGPCPTSHVGVVREPPLPDQNRPY